jgi:uncharacterized protein YbjQ (UPF0145 family)
MEFIILLVLLILGFGFGQLAEKRHFKSLIQREKDTLSMPVVTLRKVPAQITQCNTFLVSGNVVVSIDFFKNFVAGLRNLVGGRLRSYETLLDRARREAILRMKQEALEQDAKMIINVRIETSSISKSIGRNESVGSVEVLAYGTAISI